MLTPTENVRRAAPAQQAQFSPVQFSSVIGVRQHRARWQEEAMLASGGRRRIDHITGVCKCRAVLCCTRAVSDLP
jgi:hypothetical protein